MVQAFEVDASVANAVLAEHDWDVEKAADFLSRAMEASAPEDSVTGNTLRLTLHSLRRQPTRGRNRWSAGLSSRQCVYRTILLRFGRTEASPFLGNQGRRATQRVYAKALRRNQSAMPSARQLLDRSWMGSGSQAVAVPGAVESEEGLVPIGVDTTTCCQQVSPIIRVVCSFFSTNIPVGASGDRPIWCTQHPFSPLILGTAFSFAKGCLRSHTPIMTRIPLDLLAGI